MILRITFLGMLFGALLWSAGAAGQPVPSGGDAGVGDAGAAGPARGSEEPTGEATVVGSSARALERVPGATTVVPEREITRTQPLSGNEVLRRVPGIVVRDEEGMGLRPNIGIRGLDPTRSRRVLLLEDGIPVGLNPYGEPDSYYAPPIERVQRLEVVRGSGNILYGPQTIGGVLNYVTAPPPAQRAWSVRGLAGDRGLLGFHALYGNTVGNAGYVFSVLRRQGEGFRRMGFEVTELYGKVRLRLSPRMGITARVSLYDEGSSSTYLGLTAAMFARDPTQNPAPYDFLRMRRYTLGVIHEWTLTEGVRLRTLAYAYATDRDWHRQLFDREPVDDLAYARIVGDRSLRGGAIYLRDAARSNNRYYEVYGLEPRVTAQLGRGPLRVELDAGARVLVERAVLQVYFGDSQVARSGSLYSDEQRDGVALAGYVQGRFVLRDRFQVTPGLRVERYGYGRRFRRDENRDVFRRGSDQVLTAVPGVAVSYGSQAVTAFAGVHRGYAPPRVSVAIDPQGRDAQLDAELSVNYELGTRINLGTWLRSEATVFAIDFQNEIVPSSMAGGAGSQYINGGAARHLGFEGMAGVDLGRLARVPTNVFANLRYTFVDARFVGGAHDGNVVPYAPVHSLVATAGVEHPAGFAFQASWLWVGPQFTDGENTVQPDASDPDAVLRFNAGLIGVMPAFDTLDLAARYTHRPTGLGASLTVKNVLDRVYVATRAPDGIFPAGFRQVMVGLRWDP